MIKKIVYILVAFLLLLIFIWLFRPGHRLVPSVEIGKVAPQFTVSDIHNRNINLTDFKGGYVLLDFWLMNCGPCREDLPTLLSLNEEYEKSELTIIGISSDNQKNDFLEYLNENNIDWIQILDNFENDTLINKMYGIKAYPTYILIDREGIVVDWSVGDIPSIPI